MLQLIGNYIFESEYENVFFPTDGAKLLKRDFVSQDKCFQMDPRSRLGTCTNEKTAPFDVVIGVVSATTSPMPKSERESVL